MTEELLCDSIRRKVWTKKQRRFAKDMLGHSILIILID
nr:MAG TPA: hypothetical protein [Caudoviricetes sp.]DAO66300.1 MAG TPA: hypothetical protein [Caudoviricetes sp.]DAX17564.1 MAG TPA: hypothetical protein [Caudoviricetes sp.]